MDFHLYLKKKRRDSFIYWSNENVEFGHCMYTPSDFKENNPSEIVQFLNHNSLGIIISSTGVFEPIVSHIPFLVAQENEDLILEGHIAVLNPQVEHLRKGKTCMVVFQGPNTYISSSVYTHENVPTWNYQAVHVYGTVEEMTALELEQHLKLSVEKFESRRHKQLHFEQFSPSMIAAYSKEIHGVRIRSYKTEVAFKMSQNRSEVDYKNIVDDLSSSPDFRDLEVAKVMQKKSNHKKG